MMPRATTPIVALTLMIGCASTPRQIASAALEAPAVLSPPDGSIFHTFPRRLVMEWAPVPGAATYAVEIDYFEAGLGWNSDRTGGFARTVPTMSAPTYAMDFVGDQPGRWRVWAVDAAGQPGVKSAWLKFSWDTRPRMAGANGVTPARPIYSPTPSYSASAAKEKVGGDVLLNLTIGADGLVKDAVVLKSLRPDLDDSAVRTVKTWRFEPGSKDGQPIESSSIVNISFSVR